ncbi:hypothetical protein ACJIZ3_023241 [Penstemon smallii]|uniref:Mechanosensitive ion channel protein 2, chloroplastic-like n=1 Tax=Penstemon smallii TaxID=265156 RepID=A0ABD3TPK8_9LAMI
MAASGSLQLPLELGICRNHGRDRRFRNLESRGKVCVLSSNLSSISVQQYSWSSKFSRRMHRRVCTIPHRNNQFRCHCFLNRGSSLDASSVKNVTLTLARSFNCLQGSPVVIKLASAFGIIIFAIWGLRPLMQHSRNIFLHKSDSSWKKSSTYEVTTSYIQPLLLWAGAIFICRSLDPMILPSEAGQIVKQRLLNFVRSLSTVLAFAYCLSSVIQQTQKFFMEKNNPTDTRNMGFQFAGKAVYTAVWVAAVSLFMELLGFSTQKWLTAGGLGTVLLTLAGREIFTNFLSSAMIHATRPFVVNEWIQTKIEGYDVSGTVEHVGWWSPTIVRGENREAVHIPNHQFTMNVVRNLSQKTHWRIKTHLAISHLDIRKINSIVADMRKVLAKNPQVEQQKLHRRVFLDNINPENQALMILVSCFVKTSHFEEYLCVKEAIFLDLLRVIRHHRARLATPIRTVQKIYSDADLDNVPFSDSVFNTGAALNRPLLLIEPSYKSNGEDKSKPTVKPSPDGKVGAKGETSSNTNSKSKETASNDFKTKQMLTSDVEVEQNPKEDPKFAAKSSDTKLNKSSKPASKTDIKSVEETSSNAKTSFSLTDDTSNNKNTQKVKQDDARQPLTTKPSLEENIVLGVALEGSKRTLPIEEETTVHPPNLEKAKLRIGNGLIVNEKEKNDSIKQPNNPGGSPPSVQLDEQD